MNSITVQGQSDDLIEIDDAENGADELGGYKPKHLTFNDGTVLYVEYSPEGYDGKWRIERVEVGTANYLHNPAPDDEDEGYSDVVNLTGPGLKLVGAWREREPTEEELLESIGNLEGRRLSADQLTRILGIVNE
jgi:hypothetical protein